MSHHRYPTCPASGKVRYGDRKDVKLAMRQADWDRSKARLNNLACSRREIRSYECSDCQGWHLTSRPAQPARPIRLLTAPSLGVRVPGPAALAIRRMVAATGLTVGAAA